MAKLLTAAEAAKIAGISKSWLLELLRTGRVKGTRATDGWWMVDPADLKNIPEPPERNGPTPRGGVSIRRPKEEEDRWRYWAEAEGFATLHAWVVSTLNDAVATAEAEEKRRKRGVR